MKDANNIQKIAQLNPDYLGFIFYDKSKRFVGDDFSPTLLEELPKHINKVGVFVNSPIDYVLAISDKFDLNFLQLHGEESANYCEQLFQQGKKLIKAFAIDNYFDFSILNVYKPFISYFLFDTKGKEYGGNGLTFDWSLLEQYDGEIPLFLSGGIGLEEIPQLQKLDYKSLNIKVIDVNSRIELAPGLKDVAKAKELVNAIASLK